MYASIPRAADSTHTKPAYLNIVAEVLRDAGIAFHMLSAPNTLGLEVAVCRPSGFTYLVHWLPRDDGLEVQVFIPIAHIGDEAERTLCDKIVRLNKRFAGDIILHFERTPHTCLYKARVFQRRILCSSASTTPPYELIRNYLPVVEEVANTLGVFADALVAETAPRPAAQGETYN